MKTKFYFFLFFILLALFVWGIGYLYAPDLPWLTVGRIMAHVCGFVALFFLALYLRAKSLGGEDKIRGVPGKGTTVTIRIPLKTVGQELE